MSKSLHVIRILLPQKFPRWRSTVRFKYIRSIDNKPIKSKEEFIETVKEKQGSGKKLCEMELMADESDAPTMSIDGNPQIYFDQMNTIHYQLKYLTLKPKQENWNVTDINHYL